MSKFGEIELVLSDKQMAVLRDIRDLLVMEVSLSKKVLELIESVTAPPREEELEDALNG